ncbi:DUF2141 domain-containing protein [Parvibium lacunae]|uniref:DUF2141 domain-containing protein n=1 Tax=Parvibium lacunae TaxID=1888893 RepID=A0A368L1S8_9BURK|nr:DUF2141 domain-containing protein [Parvibium lacunae]RCS57516.1 DUF2141 domain-containing protein [Parvibium lacunae]
MKSMPLLFALFIPLFAGANELTLQINLPSNQAAPTQTVYIAVFDQAGYLRKPLQSHRLAPDALAQRTLVLTDLPGEAVAISAFLDSNGNQVLDKNLLARPIEPVGFSNQASMAFGPPTWAAVKVLPQGQRIEITLQP